MIDESKLARLPGPLRERYESDPGYWEKAVLVALGEGPPPPRLALVPASVPVLDPWLYVTLDMLSRDTIRLMERLPADLDLVVAVSRSGLLPGADIALCLHLPLMTVSRQRGLVDPGHGFRMEGRPPREPGHVLIIDDTVASGREMHVNAATVRAAFPDARLTRAVVYAHPDGFGAVDLYASVYPGNHYLEWNWPNAGHGERCAYDFDGILCRDCPVEDDDDGPKYLRFLETALPKFLPRRLPVPLVVTARHERYRAPTLAWLARYGVRVNRLVMRDWPYDLASDRAEQIGAWKAAHFLASDCTLFAESDPAQARVIFERTGWPVLCPDLGRVLTDFPRLIAACPFRTLRSTCCEATAVCGLGKGQSGIVDESDCLRCVAVV